jgi:tetratricopeptide (TPR) repeat protein
MECSSKEDGVSRTLPRLTALSLVLLVVSLSTRPGLATGAAGQDPQAPPAQMMGSTPPEQPALDAAMRLTKTLDRLAALDKIRKDYPQSRLLNTIDSLALASVLQLPDATEAAGDILDRMLARIPAAATPDARFAATMDPVSQLISKKVLLDRAEALLTSASTAGLGPQAGARGHYELGRIAAARGDMTRAEAEYKAAAPHWAAAVSSLVTMYVGRGEPATAEAFLLEVVKGTPVNMAALTSLTNLYASQPARAEAILKDAVGRDPRLPTALLSLARLEQQRGDDRSALDHYMKAAAMLYLRGADGDAMRALYGKLHGGTDGAGLEAEINALYLALPKALTPTPYTPTPRRTDRLVVLEMFTGSACPPCVAADLAFDAALDRYPASAIVPLAYHQHIPGPDPMTTTAGTARGQVYGLAGVPTLHIDGLIVAGADGGTFGGGGRDRAPVVFDKYTGIIDAALDAPSQAAVAVRGAIAGDTVTVTADITTLPAGAGDLRLHIVLAERELLFGGENGIRSHAMVVRGVAGENGLGLPLAGTGTTQHTFDLAVIRADVSRSLAADIARRRAAGGAAQSFAAEDRAMTRIDPAHLVVIAFVQAPNRQILQAARADVATAAR